MGIYVTVKHHLVSYDNLYFTAKYKLAHIIIH